MKREQAKPPKRWKHKKRGTVYRILHDRVPFQCSTNRAHDNQSVVIYQNIETEAVYVRPATEFFDGRFEPV